MPDYEVVLTYTMEYTGTVTVKARNEEAAQAMVQKNLGEAEVQDLASFEKFCDEVELTEENIEIEEVN